MRYAILIFSLIIFIFACTKEVPESEKKMSRLAEEKIIQETVLNFVSAYNSNDIEKSLSFVTTDYHGISFSSEDITSIGALRRNLNFLHKQYPSGQWKTVVEEINIYGDLAYLISRDSILAQPVNSAEKSTIYSSRAIRIMKKEKNDGWKIFRCFSVINATDSKNNL